MSNSKTVQNQNRSTGGSKKTGSAQKKGTSSKVRSSSGTKRLSAAEKERLKKQSELREEILILLFFALSILLTLCNFKVTSADGLKRSMIGSFGTILSSMEFGIFGWPAYLAPILLFFAVIFGYLNQGLFEAQLKLFSGVVLFLLFEIMAALFGGIDRCGSSLKDYYEFSKEGAGGGVIGALLGRALHTVFGMVGTIIILLILTIICVVILTERSFLKEVRKGSKKVYETAIDDAAYRRERSERRREEKRIRELELLESQNTVKRSDKKVSGVAFHTIIPRKEEAGEDIHELMPKPKKKQRAQVHANEDISELHSREPADREVLEESAAMSRRIVSAGIEEAAAWNESKEMPADNREAQPDFGEVHDSLLPDPVKVDQAGDDQEDPLAHIHVRGLSGQTPKKEWESENKEPVRTTDPIEHAESAKDAASAAQQTTASKVTVSQQDLDISEDIQKQAEIVTKKEYVKPSFDLLKKGENKASQDSERQLKETALHLQNTLKTFGVNVTITDISQGPAVTRYELQPEQGVKVSKIVGLSDDIKLNLAATDIRIEAPIPGKAAIGIEVPNKENAAVAFRDLLETPDFRDFKSNLAFAVGKDIAGQPVVTDIAKMPHLLIAGATGSGKSVCINTLIMSLLYKSSPDDVKLIMIDPKVVELSVYNGIPHLMIPVVTDPKKAAGALAWGVTEMTERYKKFADLNVRKIDEYNKKIAQMDTNDGAPLPDPMPQIVIIVDELADLMMVAPGEVEESICRLAQLARAAGIHLVIATQRPSVDVITGLIKANMPSRIAFAVSSGVDSRTILDMNGAEKLLGKGDMLFYPQGLSKPVRVQGAFVSDQEVSRVVEFLKGQCGEAVYSSDVEQKITVSATAAGAGIFGQDAASERDVYFYDAGTFIIEKEKASIGMLQRVFKIGFNRAARIMDQLAEAGVVGEEEGTKPRKVLMTQEQFEEFVNQSS